ncbi:MAG: LamG-like jellyroll fold domain-containing protein, partial [Planctomycetota bacterium]
LGHHLALFTWGDVEVVDRFYVGAAELEADTAEWHDVVHTYDPVEEAHTIWIDGLPGNVFDAPTALYAPPEVSGAGNQSVLIGMTLGIYPPEDGALFMTGDMDDFMVYDYALSWEEIQYMQTGTTTPIPFDLDEWLDPSPNLDSDAIINFLDHAKFGDDWGKAKPFE